MARAVDQARRLAAGHACLGLFHLLSSGVAHPLRMVAETRSEGLGRGLHEKERSLMMTLSTDAYDMAEVLRILGWRFLGRPTKRRRS